jgi:isopenicillin N synthase-like dioxygenase
MAESIVPIIDIYNLVKQDSTLEERKSVAEELRRACEDVGFVVITGHQVPLEIVDRVWKSTKAFFDSSLEEKTTCTRPQDVYPFGYSPVGAEVLSAGKAAEKSDTIISAPPDIKEMFSLGPADPKAGFPARIFPANPADFEEAWTVYYETLTQLARRILIGFALALNLEESFFENFIGHHASALRAINYPAIAPDVEVLPGQLRASAHTDYGTITILRTDGPGLQVSKDSDNPTWHDVPFIENAFIINLGDLMRRWTNDKWMSTLHRVVISSSDLSNGFTVQSADELQYRCRRRQSLAFFHNLNRDARVEVLVKDGEIPKHEPIIAGDFLRKKHLASVGMKG